METDFYENGYTFIETRIDVYGREVEGSTVG
ncbi:MAG: hypothetical protein ACI9GO_000564 [Bacteroidia bacterium]|jgi:hypothetical protein